MGKSIFKNKDVVYIEDRNTSVTVQPYKLGDIPSLEYRLSVYDEIYHRVDLLGMDYDIENKKLYLPKCIDISKIEDRYRLKDVKIINTKSDSKTKIKFNIKFSPRNDVQIKAIDFLVGRDKYSSNIFYPRLLLSLETGEGKTFCALAAISQIGYKAAIIVPDNNLIDRWVDEIYKMTDLNEDDIYIIKGNKSLKKIKKKTKDKKIILISHRTISNFGNSYGWEYIEEIFKAMKIGIKVYDEAHKEFKNITKIDLHTNTEKTIYLTATAGRSVMKENKIFNTIFSNIPKLVTYSKVREENHINMIILKYTSRPAYNDTTRCKTIKGFSALRYMEYNMNTGRLHFQRAIQVAMNTVLSKSDGRVLLMLGTINMIFMTKTFLEETYPSFKDDIGIYCSAVNKNVKDDTIKNKKIILSTFKSLGTGSDIEDLKYVIMAEPYSSKLTASQAPGRLREKGWYFELVDIGFSDCSRQFENRKKTLIKKAKKFKIIDM